MKTISQIKSFLKQCKLSELLVCEENIRHNAYFLIENLSQDHCDITVGDAFIALKGKTHDGHQFVNEALQKGAKLIIVEDITQINVKEDRACVIELKQLRTCLAQLAYWFYGNSSNMQKVIAVTGTNGKTSICHFIAQILTRLSTKVGVLGTIGNGIFPELSTSALTTLDSIALQRSLRYFADNQVEVIAMEASSHAIDQNRIAKTNITTAVFSNLDIDHLDYHHTMEKYFAAKVKLFIMSSVKSCIINKDDVYGKRLSQILQAESAKQIISYSLTDKNADYYMPIKKILPTGFEVEIHWQQQCQDNIVIPVLGIYNLSNIAAAISTLLVNAYSFVALVEALPKLQNATGRLEQLVVEHKPLVVIDYAHTADALEKALKALRSQTNGKLYCVFGCGGARDHGKRPLMAKAVQAYADFCVITEDNSRTDSIKDIVKDILSGFDSKYTKFVVIEDRKEAIEYVLSRAQKTDVILLAGKGHETYLDKDNQKIYFDERQVVRNFWNKND